MLEFSLGCATRAHQLSCTVVPFKRQTNTHSAARSSLCPMRTVGQTKQTTIYREKRRLEEKEQHLSRRRRHHDSVRGLTCKGKLTTAATTMMTRASRSRSGIGQLVTSSWLPTTEWRIVASESPASCANFSSQQQVNHTIYGQLHVFSFLSTDRPTD